MSFKIDLGTDLAEYVVNVGEVILGNKKRKAMDPHLQKTQDEVISQAICALLNSGGGVVKIEACQGYNYTSHGVGLNEHPIFKGYLDEMQEKDLFFIFVKSWNAKSSGVRLATLCSNLYRRHKTSTDVMTPREALAFLQGRKTQAPPLAPGSGLSRPPDVQEGVQNERNIKASAAALFDRPHLQYLEKLDFTKSTHVEFKMFPAEVSECFSDSLPSCVSAFANTEGGYIFWGVQEETLQVIGCVKERIDPSALKDSIGSCIRKLPVHHFCSQKHEIKYEIKFLEVRDQGALHGYVCAVKVEQFCCAVFARQPSSWQVTDSCVTQLTIKEWVAWMTEADPDLSRFSEMFLELSLSSTTPRGRAVCTHKNLECLETQQKCYFPVSSDSVLYRPQSLYKELFSQHKGLRNLINKQLRNVSQGILVFSRSWAVDVGLPEEQGVICDALLLSLDQNPVLITVFGEHIKKDYCIRVAHALKLKLVNTGSYTENLCIIPSAFLLNPAATSTDLPSSELQKYPESYKLTTVQQMEALLRSLVIVLRGFRSLLSEELGSEVLNLLTDKQYELLSKNLRKTKELFVHGLPGSGKTILALKIIEKISNVFHCQASDILYICENKPLQEFVSHKNICRTMTRKTFMKNSTDVEKIKHILIDEAQNFRLENGNWYMKAKAILREEKECHGILWIFLDYFQTSHMADSGLPHLQDQYPREELTRVVRNADPIANYLQELMQEVREKPPPNIPPKSLQMLSEAEWAQGVPGNLEVMEYPNLEQMVGCIIEKCQFLLRQGYTCKDIAVLCSTASEAEVYEYELQRAMRKRSSESSEESHPFVQLRNASDVSGNHIVLDSVRRFSGLERNIVFGIDPQSAEPAIFLNFLLCLASRARKHLYIMKISN